MSQLLESTTLVVPKDAASQAYAIQKYERLTVFWKPGTGNTHQCQVGDGTNWTDIGPALAGTGGFVNIVGPPSSTALSTGPVGCALYLRLNNTVAGTVAPTVFMVGRLVG